MISGRPVLNVEDSFVNYAVISYLWIFFNFRMTSLLVLALVVRRYHEETLETYGVHDTNVLR